MHVGFDLTAKAANDLVFDGAIKQIVPIHSSRLETTGVKTMTITLKYKHVPEDASLGFYRSGMHQCVGRLLVILCSCPCLVLACAALEPLSLVSCCLPGSALLLSNGTADWILPAQRQLVVRERDGLPRR